MKKTTTGAFCTLFFILFHTSTFASLIINEVDYDQPGVDSAEFIELLNSGPNLLNLDGYRVSLINSTTGSQYRSFNLPDLQLASNGFFVLCGDSDQVINCGWDISPSSNLIQNGSADAIALFLGIDLVDSLSYEGNLPGYTEGAGDQLADLNSLSYIGLSRTPDGHDSNHNNLDFRQACITPGATNSLLSSGCSAPTIATVPEPTSLLLMMIGLITLISMRPGLQIDNSLGTKQLHEPT